MKQSILMVTVIGFVLLFFACNEQPTAAPELSQSEYATNTMAKKPAPNLVGTLHADFTFTPPTFWNGTIDFGALGIYGITFVSHGAPRDYSQASPFYEDFTIYELGNPANVFAVGWEKGVSAHANRAPEPMKFFTNGKIEEAYGPLAAWQGRNLHGSGTVENWVDDPTFGWIPEYAISTIRIN